MVLSSVKNMQQIGYSCTHRPVTVKAKIWCFDHFWQLIYEYFKQKINYYKNLFIFLYTFRGSKCQLFSEKKSTPKEKSSPWDLIVFPFRVESFLLRSWCAVKQTRSHKSCLPWQKWRKIYQVNLFLLNMKIFQDSSIPPYPHSSHNSTKCTHLCFNKSRVL